MEPWVHYVPLEYWFGNLHTVTEWAADPVNSEALRTIAQNGRRFVDAVLRPAAVLDYAVELLRGYEAALRYRVHKRKDAQDAASFLAYAQRDEDPLERKTM